MKKLITRIRDIPHIDKVLHFLGSGLLSLIFTPIPTFFIGLGIEVGDFKNHGWGIIKSKDKKKIKEYVANTVMDLMADILGILIFALIIGVL